MKRKRLVQKEESFSLTLESVEREVKRRKLDPTLFSPSQETELDIMFGYNDFYEFHGPLELIFLYIPFREIIDTSFKVCKNFYLASIQSLWKRNMKEDEVKDLFFHFTDNLSLKPRYFPSKGICKLLYDMRAFDFTLCNCVFLYHCCRNGFIDIVRGLLKEDNMRLTSLGEFNDDAFAVACLKGHVGIVKLLLKDKRVDPSNWFVSRQHPAITFASDNGHLEVVRILMNDNRVDPSDDYNSAIRKASTRGHLEIVRLLMNDNRVDPSVDDNYAIRIVSTKGYIDLVRLLLNDNRVDPSDVCNDALRNASANGHLEIVRILMKDNRVDPSDVCNEALRNASANGHLEIVRILLNDDRVDHCNDCDEYVDVPIVCASAHGHVNIVQLLLNDSRVDPSGENNKAIRQASSNGHIEIVRLLMNDNRVDPSDFDNGAIKQAANNGHFEIVRLLLNDDRVDLNAICYYKSE